MEYSTDKQFPNTKNLLIVGEEYQKQIGMSLGLHFRVSPKGGVNITAFVPEGQGPNLAMQIRLVGDELREFLQFLNEAEKSDL